MKEFNLWDLIKAFGTMEEKDFFINCADSVYDSLDDKVCDLCIDISDLIKERMKNAN